MEEDTNSRPDLHGSVHMRSPDSAGGRAILHASMGGSSPSITLSTEMTLLECKLVNKLKQLARKLRCVCGAHACHVSVSRATLGLPSNLILTACLEAGQGHLSS